MTRPLNADAEAMCLRHRRLVRWMPAPGWWYHVHRNSETCMAMWNDFSPLIFMHDGKPSIPPWQLRGNQQRMRAMLRAGQR